MENSDIFQPEETFKFWGVYELNFRVFIQKKFPAQSISLLPENETCKTGLTFFLYFSKNIIWKFNDTTVINSLLCSSWGTLYFCKTKKSMLRQYFATALEPELPTLFFFQKKKKTTKKNICKTYSYLWHKCTTWSPVTGKVSSLGKGLGTPTVHPFCTIRGKTLVHLHVASSKLS